MTQVLPNFLIAGAAKSGTTSLYYYLMDHPEIYFSPIKEPDFLTSPILKHQKNTIKARRPYISTIDEYYQLFSGVKDEKAIGEASTDTMFYHQTSIPRIKSILGEPKVLIILRNPTFASFSMYTHMIRDDREELSFEDALLKEEERIKENYQCAYLYKSRFLYYEQVKAFVESMKQVKVLIYEEFLMDIPGTIKNVCEFLEVDTSYVPSNSHIRYNASGVPKFAWFNKVFLMYNPIQRSIRNIGSTLLTPTRYVALRDTIRQKNMRRAQIKPETLAYLKEYFREDITKLQSLLDIDLTIWLK